MNSKLSQIEYDPWLCAKNYALTWLPLDLVSGIPFHIINYLFEGDSAPVLKVVKSLRLLRILKLTRLFKLEHMVKKAQLNNVRYCWQSSLNSYSLCMCYRFNSSKESLASREALKAVNITRTPHLPFYLSVYTLTLSSFFFVLQLLMFLHACVCAFVFLGVHPTLLSINLTQCL